MGTYEDYERKNPRKTDLSTRPGLEWMDGVSKYGTVLYGEAEYKAEKGRTQALQAQSMLDIASNRDYDPNTRKYALGQFINLATGIDKLSKKKAPAFLETAAGYFGAGDLPRAGKEREAYIARFLYDRLDIDGKKDQEKYAEHIQQGNDPLPQVDASTPETLQAGLSALRDYSLNAAKKAQYNPSLPSYLNQRNAQGAKLAIARAEAAAKDAFDLSKLIQKDTSAQLAERRVAVSEGNANAAAAREWNKYNAIADFVDGKWQVPFMDTNTGVVDYRPATEKDLPRELQAEVAINRTDGMSLEEAMAQAGRSFIESKNLKNEAVRLQNQNRETMMKISNAKTSSAQRAAYSDNFKKTMDIIKGWQATYQNMVRKVKTGKKVPEEAIELRQQIKKALDSLAASYGYDPITGEFANITPDYDSFIARNFTVQQPAPTQKNIEPDISKRSSPNTGSSAPAPPPKNRNNPGILPLNN